MIDIKLHAEYHLKVYELRYLSVFNITYIITSVSVLSCRLHATSRNNIYMVKKDYSYFYKTRNNCYFYFVNKPTTEVLKAYSDSDWEKFESIPQSSTVLWIRCSNILLNGSVIRWLIDRK